MKNKDNKAIQDLQHGWETFGDSGEFDIWAAAGIKVPKLVENVPSIITDWDKYWNSLPYPESCGEQGFFYPDEDEDYEDDDIFYTDDDEDE